METRYLRAQKDEALEVFRKQLEKGSVMSGEIQELSKKLNIPTATLYGWKVELKKKLLREGNLQLETSGFSSKDKFQAVVDTNSMSELEVGEYLRKHGILKEELRFWKESLENAFNGKFPNSDPEISKKLADEKALNKKLERELRYKEKALAETAALLVLQKAVSNNWSSDFSTGATFSVTIPSKNLEIELTSHNLYEVNYNITVTNAAPSSPSALPDLSSGLSTIVEPTFENTSNFTFACTFTVSVGIGSDGVDSDILAGAPNMASFNVITFWWYSGKYLSSTIYKL